MRRAKGVVDENIGQRGQLLAQLGVVLRLALFKAGVLEQHDLAVLERGGLRLRVLTGDVLGHDDRLAEQLAQAVGDDLKAQLGLVLALGLAHVGAENDLRVVVDEIANGRQRGDDSLVAGDLAVLGWNVKVAAAEHALAADIDLFYGFLIVVHVYLL